MRAENKKAEEMREKEKINTLAIKRKYLKKIQSRS